MPRSSSAAGTVGTKRATGLIKRLRTSERPTNGGGTRAARRAMHVSPKRGERVPFEEQLAPATGTRGEYLSLPGGLPHELLSRSSHPAPGRSVGPGSALSGLAADADEHRRRGDAALAVADLVAEPVAAGELARGEV